MTKTKTPIVDKNGKATHVYKSDTPKASSRVQKAPKLGQSSSYPVTEFIPAKPGAVGCENYAFFFYNDASEDYEYYGGYMNDYIEFESDDIRNLRKEIDEWIDAAENIQNDPIQKDSFSPQTQYEQVIALGHVKALKEQLAEPDGLKNIIKRGKVHTRIFDKINSGSISLEEEWGLEQAAIEKIFAYGNAVKQQNPDYSNDEFGLALWNTLAANEHFIVDENIAYISDLPRIYKLIDKEMQRSGFTE